MQIYFHMYVIVLETVSLLLNDHEQISRFVVHKR